MAEKRPIRIRSLESDGTRYVFTEPVSFDVEYVDGAWVYSNELLSVSGFADTRELALKELAEAMDYLWREIAKASDSALDDKAVELKTRLLASVTPKPPTRKVR